MKTPNTLSLPAEIRTQRLLLRPYQPEDGGWYYAMSLRNKPHLARYESGNPVMNINSVEDTEKVMRDFAALWQAGQTFFLGAFRLDTGDFVAQVYIGTANPELPEYELGYFCDVDQQGQGYVSEACRAALRFIFEDLHAWRVRLECDDSNAGSVRVAEACGLRREGHMRENKRNTDGSLSRTFHYGLIQSEYSQFNSKS